MTIDEFWKLVEGLPVDEPEEVLQERLSDANSQTLMAFQKHFDQLEADAYRWDLWGAAYLIGGGCSDDGFVYFRRGVISRGKEVYEAAISDPDSIASIADEDSDDDFLEQELFGYVASELYEELTDSDMPSNDVAYPAEPAGEQWDFDDEDLCAKRFPKLWEKFAG